MKDFPFCWGAGRLGPLEEFGVRYFDPDREIFFTLHRFWLRFWIRIVRGFRFLRAGPDIMTWYPANDALSGHCGRMGGISEWRIKAVEGWKSVENLYNWWRLEGKKSNVTKETQQTWFLWPLEITLCCNVHMYICLVSWSDIQFHVDFDLEQLRISSAASKLY